MTIEGGQEIQQEEMLKQPEEIFPNTFRRLERTKNKEIAQALREALTAESLRALAQERTEYVLQFMLGKGFKPNEWFAFERVLLPKIGDKELMDAALFWQGVENDPVRLQIALDQIGDAVGVPIRNLGEELKQSGNPEVRQRTNHPGEFDVRILYRIPEGEKEKKLIYQFVKV